MLNPCFYNYLELILLWILKLSKDLIFNFEINMKYPTYLIYYAFIVIIFFLFPQSYIYAESEEKQTTEIESLSDKPSDEDEELALDDEKLMQEILEIISVSYKDIIDLSALYFCGLIDWDKLSEQMITLLHKDFFKALKLFSWYIPAILKNPKVSTFTKIKKSTYVACCIAISWYLYKEIFQGKVNQKNINIGGDSTLLDHRQHPVFRR